MKAISILLTAACICDIVSTQSDVRLPPNMYRWSGSSWFWSRNEKTTKLECDAVGIPAVTYEWKKNGFPFNTNRPNIRKESDDGTISINNATETDEGYYQCYASNKYGTAVSDTTYIVRREFFESSTASEHTIFQKTAVEGEPFCTEAARLWSFLKTSISWDIAPDVDTEYSRSLSYSDRIQVADNGDLHFAHALPKDALDGELYRCTTYAEFQRRHSYTQLNLIKSPSANISQFAPALAFASASPTVALVGEYLRLRCFFYGFPTPVISWTGPTTPLPTDEYEHDFDTDTLPTGRYRLDQFNTTLYISSVDASDEGNYSCTGSNTKGYNTQTFQIRVQVKPKFNNTMDGPHNVNVTEGESVTFNCNAFAKPEADVVWLRNGQPIDTDNPPERIIFSNDNKSLTLRDVCRDCDDRERKTDLMVIQCNASNVHGYAFAQGYVNVLMRTKVTINGTRDESGDFPKFTFQCNVTCDPSTPPTVRWFKTEPSEVLVRDAPPYVFVVNGSLTIFVPKSCSSDCAKHFGEYRCVGDNEYSRENRTITHSDQLNIPLEDGKSYKETWSLWNIILVVAMVGIVPPLVGIFVHFCWKRRLSARSLADTSGSDNRRFELHFSDIKRQAKERGLLNPVSIYEDVGYDSIGISLDELIGSSERPMSRESGVYDQMGYDSIDEVVEEIGEIGFAMPQLHDAHGHSGYETIDDNQREVVVRGRPRIHKEIVRDDAGYLIPLDEAANGDGTGQHQANGFEPVQSESEKCLKSSKQSDSRHTYSDLDRKDDKWRLEFDSTEASSHSHMILKEVNQYLDRDPKEVNPYMNSDPKEVNPYLDLNPKEVNLYLNLNPKEVIPYLDLDPEKVNQYLDPVCSELNPYLDLVCN